MNIKINFVHRSTVLPALDNYWEKSLHRISFITGTALLLSIGLVGCAGLDSTVAPELIVRKLATQRWQALMSKNFDKAYEYAVPSYRQIRTNDYYSNKRKMTPVKWLEAEVLRVECAVSKCMVKVKLESKPLVPFQFTGTLITALDETWVFEDGQWWMFETL